MSNDFSDRFLKSTYADDEPVCFSLSTDSMGARKVVEMPETLFARAQSIGRAYNLHLLPAIVIYAETALNKLQLDTLLQEIRFVQDVARDDLLSHYLGELEVLLLAGVNTSGSASVLVEGP